MTRNFKATFSTPRGFKTISFTIENDETPVLTAFLEAMESDYNDNHLELFSVCNDMGETLFTEDVLDEDLDIKLCRWCGRIIKENEGIFIEDYFKDGDCHCEDCHPLLYTEEEWVKLHKEYNTDLTEDEDSFYYQNGDSYYWTTV